MPFQFRHGLIRDTAYAGIPKARRAELHERFAAWIGFDEARAHRIEAGADFFLMPSRFEPCGLNQMYSLRYGAVPVVRATGGLDDSVVDPAQSVSAATGIKFQEYSPPALVTAIRKALALYDEPALLRKFRLNGMSQDFSWEKSARHYLRLYRGKEQGG